MSRASYLDVDEVRSLDHFALSLDVMFDANVGIIHVGSSLSRADYRDVDVRVVLTDDDYRQLAEVVNMLDLNMLLSGWGRRVTGLRIDCQIQSLAESSTEEHKSMQRHGTRGMARYREALDKALDPRSTT